jgi:transcriptional regulator with XRE-family HTH domain
MDLRAVLGRRIHELRTEAGLSQATLAMSAGLDRAFVGAVERGDKAIGLEGLGKLARALGVEAWQLLHAPRANPPEADGPGRRLLRRVAVLAEGATEAEATAFGLIAEAFFSVRRGADPRPRRKRRRSSR